MKCLTHEQLDMLLCGMASVQEQMDWLEHTSECDACAEALALRTAQMPSVKAPRGMRSQVLAKTQAKQQESMMHYTLRVVAAMAAALILVFSGAFAFLEELPETLPEIQANIHMAITEFSFTEFFDFTQGGINDAPESE